MIEQRHFIEANTTNEDDLRLRRLRIRRKALGELKMKALLIFMIWIILHTCTHMIMRPGSLSPKEGPLGPQKEPTSLEKTRKLQLHTARKSMEPTRLVIRS
jgi:hypothetical protein